VITGWRGEGKSKQQIIEDRENFIKENIGEAKFKDCCNIKKDQVLVKQKGKLREKKETEKIFIHNDLTKQEREIQKKLKK
jgi:hypothetical protein